MTWAEALACAKPVRPAPLAARPESAGAAAASRLSDAHLHPLLLLAGRLALPWRRHQRRHQDRHPQDHHPPPTPLLGLERHPQAPLPLLDLQALVGGSSAEPTVRPQ